MMDNENELFLIVLILEINHKIMDEGITIIAMCRIYTYTHPQGAGVKYIF